MLREMRTNTKVILWIVVVAFVGSIGLVWGADVLDVGQRQGPAVSYTHLTLPTN